MNSKKKNDIFLISLLFLFFIFLCKNNNENFSGDKTKKDIDNLKRKHEHERKIQNIRQTGKSQNTAPLLITLFAIGSMALCCFAMTIGTGIFVFKHTSKVKSVDVEVSADSSY